MIVPTEMRGEPKRMARLCNKQQQPNDEISYSKICEKTTFRRFLGVLILAAASPSNCLAETEVPTSTPLTTLVPSSAPTILPCVIQGETGCDVTIPCCTLTDICGIVSGESVSRCIPNAIETPSPSVSPTSTREPEMLPASQGDGSEPPAFLIETLPPQGPVPFLASPTAAPSPQPIPDPTPRPSLRSTNQAEDNTAPTYVVETLPPQSEIPYIAEPTVAPSLETPPPVPAPTPPPTMQSTPPPTMQSTPPATPGPSLPLTLEPTISSTPLPTPPPSLPPSDPPTDAPTLPPTSPPTKSPSTVPTLTPSGIPTGTPTVRPTQSPTETPTMLPSYSPSVSPTDKPTSAMPSVTPGNPTREPSASPTNFPSQSPSISPSLSPTISPAPTVLPTLFPTQSPAPSLRPTTAQPTPEPTLAPTLPLQSFLVELTMTMEAAEQLFGNSISRYQSTTAGHIDEELDQQEEPFSDLTVFTIIRRQDEISAVPAPAPSRVLENDASRRLQEGVLRVRADAGVTFKSQKSYTEDEIADLVAGAFDTEDDRNVYMQKLRDTGDPAFGNVQNLVVLINGEMIDNDEGDGDSGSDFPVVIVAAAGGGGLAVVALAALLYLRRSRRSKLNGNGLAATMASPTTTTGERIQTDIIVEPQDDISTLGDPTFAAGGMVTGVLEKDETVSPSIVSGDYDYAKAYGTPQEPPSVSTNTMESKPFDESSGRDSSGVIFQAADSLFSDDSSFEQQYNEPDERFVVDAPPGKLGVVIDTPSNGIPVVHAIKETSVLADRVRVGDQLVEVDGEDTTQMTAMQVSKAISIRSENPSRKLVFIRSRAKGDD